MSDWRDTTLGEFVALQRGHDLTEPQRRNGHVPVMGSAGQNGFHDTALAKGPGIVIGRSGASFGQVHFSKEDFWPHNTGLYVTDFKGNDPLFAFYFLKALDFDRFNSGSAQPSLNRNFIYPIPMRVPKPAEQKSIASVLGALDDKIELNRRMNATLEAMARALFQSWFVDFDPVRAKLDGRKPLGMDDATAALFPKHLEDSLLGHIPKGWKAGSVVEGFNLTMGQSPPGDTYNDDGNGLPFYQGRTDFGFRFPTRRIYCSSPTRYAKPGDTLVSVRAPVGDINMANEECCIGRGVAAVRHKSGATSFTYHSMASLYPDFARFEAEGTVFGSINKDSFEKLRFVIPPTEIIAAYERQAGPLDEQIRTLEIQARTLATLRDTLLPKLLSGELSFTRGNFSAKSVPQVHPTTLKV